MAGVRRASRQLRRFGVRVSRIVPARRFISVYDRRHRVKPRATSAPRPPRAAHGRWAAPSFNGLTFDLGRVPTLGLRRIQRRQGTPAMKLYNSVGPNPHVVRMFIAEKGLDIPKVEVDLMKGENRQEPHLKRNPHGQMPTLELDNGQFVSEILRDLRISRRQPSDAAADRRDAGGTGRNAHVDAAHRPQHRRADGDGLPLQPGPAAVQGAASSPRRKPPTA